MQQPWRARTKRLWHNFLRDPSHPSSQREKGKTRRSAKFTEDSLWQNACNKLEETLKLENEGVATGFVTSLQTGKDNGAETSIGALPIRRSHLAEDGKQAEKANEDKKGLLITQAHQVQVGNGHVADAGNFWPTGSSHQACHFGYGAGVGKLEAISTSCNDIVYRLVPGKLLPNISACREHCDKGHDAGARSSPFITVLCQQAHDINRHGSGARERSAIIASCQAQNNISYGAASNWTLLNLQEALDALEKGCQTCPSFNDISGLLHKCRSSRDQQHALRLCAYMRQNGLDSHGSLGNYLVSMLVEVGCMHDAQQIFDKLTCRNKLSWDSLITGYIKHGELYNALSLYQKMSEDESCCLSSSTYVFLLKACAKLKDLKTGTKLHAKVTSLGLHIRDAFIANSLVGMYAKCGSFANARCVLERLRTRDVIAWTALITGYAEHGLAEEALKCFETMQLEGVVPDRVLLVCILRVYGSLGALDKVQELHIEIERIGLLEKDVAIGTILIEIYASCGTLPSAQQVFDKLQNRDVVSWTALILGYAEHGNAKEALKCFDQMQCEGISPDAVTFMCILKACSSLGALDRIQEMHTQIERAGLLTRDDVIGSVLVDVYGKCGALDKALQVFNQLRVRGVVPWTALIEGYAEHQCGEEALKCFEQMHVEGVSPNAITFSCSLRACGSIGATTDGQKIHSQIERLASLKKNLIVGNALVDMYAKCGLLGKAQQVLDKLPLRDVVSWTSLIAGYAEHGHCETALKCFDQMQLEGVSPNAVTFIFCLKACGSIGAMDKGAEIHAHIESERLLERDAIVGNTLVDMYARFGMFVKAQQVFDKLPNHTVVSWTSLIARFAEHGHVEEAINCFEQMQRNCVYPNDVTYVTILKICGIIGAIDKVQELHAEVERVGLFGSKLVGNMLVFIYSKCGLLAFAQEVFEKLPIQDLVSWNSLIAGYIRLGETECALSTFDRMLGEGIRPGSITFTAVLSACSRQGLLNKSQMYFQAMSKDYGITLAPEHQCGMLDAFCRSGEFDKAKGLIQATANGSNVVMWHSLLGACKTFQNVDFGKWVFGQVLHLDGKDAASYALMCHVYGGSNKQGEECI